MPMKLNPLGGNGNLQQLLPFWIPLEPRAMEVVVPTEAIRRAESSSQILTTNKPTSNFLQLDALLQLCLTNSVKALK